MGIPPIISRPPEPIRFKLTFDLPNNQLIVEDDTKYSQMGIFASTVSGLYRITGPLGIIYANVGYTSDSFDAPDIDGDEETLSKGCSGCDCSKCIS